MVNGNVGKSFYPNAFNSSLSEVKIENIDENAIIEMAIISH